jgi:hypothetical protein
MLDEDEVACVNIKIQKPHQIWLSHIKFGSLCVKHILFWLKALGYLRQAPLAFVAIL